MPLDDLMDAGDPELLLERLVRVGRHNLAAFRRSPAAEISGALGDLGTLLPLMIALALQDAIDLPATLVFSGLFNLVTGVVFGVPLPVQPMKAIAAASIAAHADLKTTVGAGALVGLAVLLLSATGLIQLLTRHVPIPVVKGIQLGAGLSLVTSAGSSLILPLGWAHPLLDNRLWAVGAFLLLLITPIINNASLIRPPSNQNAGTPSRSFRLFFPYALVVFLLGLSFSFAHGSTVDDMEGVSPHLTPFNPHKRLSPSDLWSNPTAFSMALAQLPLTTLNSIIAAAALASDLFPSLPFASDTYLPVPTPSTTALGLSVAGMNLVGCWFGAMPVCHGAGGLAAQHRFGARSGASIIMLGLVKILLGLFFGSSLLGLLGRFPRSLLGVMVGAAGLELARVAVRGVGDGKGEGSEGETEADEGVAVMLVTAAGIVAFKNDAVGFVAGFLCHGAYKVGRYVERRWGSRDQGQMPGAWVEDDEQRPLLR